MELVVLDLFDAQTALHINDLTAHAMARSWERNTNLPQPFWLSLSEHSVRRALDYLLEHGIVAQVAGDRWRLE